MGADEHDRLVRLKAFGFLDDQTRLHGETLPRAILAAGFDLDGQRVPLLGPQGIFKPAVLPEMPLSITTVPVGPSDTRPYEDGLDEKGLLNYRYRGTDPAHRDNVGLRLAMQRQVPLVYLFGVVKGQYMPVWPVFVVGDNPGGLCFKVAVDDRRLAVFAPAPVTPYASESAEARRSYITVATMHRLHQATFRQRVLSAYGEQCAVCRLRHSELLEAAHILPDGHPRGEPVVPNGIAMCKLHHAAFDRFILGIRPDCVIEIRADILAEHDGPMLRHGLQEVAGTSLRVPSSERHRPREEFLAERYEMFREAG
jgi:putative restriction endonuclease